MKLKHYLIASENNNYRPWITSTSAMVYFTVVIWGLRLLLPINLTFANGAIDPTDVLNRVNRERTNRNLPTLVTNDKLAAAAQSKSQDMLSRSYFSHVDPDGHYVWPKIEAAGYSSYSMLGENLAMDFTSAFEMVAAWMASPTHRTNILNDKFEDQGLGIASGLFEANHDSILVTNLFGKQNHLSAKVLATQPVAPVNQINSSKILALGTDSKLNITQVSGQTLVDLNISAMGEPKLITAKLKSQSITLLKQSDGRFSGTFTFDQAEQLTGEKIAIQARDSTGSKVTASITLAEVPTLATSDRNPQVSNSTSLTNIPISNQAQIYSIMRLVFGILSLIYLTFLITDWIIIHRAKVSRPGMHLGPQIIIFFLIAAINIYAKF